MTTTVVVLNGVGSLHRGELIIGIEDDPDPTSFLTDDNAVGDDPDVLVGQVGADYPWRG